jgi:2-oxoacid:acceptor oxidoreductase delta subunit (pyruvate/2-ketoisovalerate family)
MSEKITLKRLDEYPPLPISKGHMDWNKTGAWRYVDPIHIDKLSPCNNACPAGEDIQKYIQLITQKKYAEAYETIREVNPLPATTGRVCYHPCEANCNRREFDEEISIHYLERFLGDYGLEHVRTKRARRDKEKGEIAIIGSGPAGLTAAWHLTNMGYKVTVFEALDKAGGMLRVGIPEYRLPRKVLDSEIAAIEKRGVTIKTGIRVGEDLPFGKLDKYRAVFLAVGAHKSKPMRVPGEDLPGVEPGLKFLAEVNAGKRKRISGKVAIIGGGNTAIDVARCVLRVGGKPVIYYRRTYHEMPAIREEISEAEHESIEINFLTAPLEITKYGRKLKLKLQKMKLGRKDESGRRRPVPIKGASETVVVTKVLTAIGEDPDLSFLPEAVQHERWGIDTQGTHQTSSDEVFAGGDCAEDRRAVSDAIGAGRLGAQAIDKYLRGEKVFLQSVDRVVTHFSDLNLSYFSKAPGPARGKLADKKRMKSFAEVNVGLSEEQAVNEAARCFSCGVCNACDNCWVFCPDIAISRKDGKYVVNYDYCKGCGICVNECPRDAIQLEVRGVS